MLNHEAHDREADRLTQIFRLMQEQSEDLGYTGFDLSLQWYDNPYVGEILLFRRWRYGWERRRLEVMKERNEKLFA